MIKATALVAMILLLLGCQSSSNHSLLQTSTDQIIEAYQRSSLNHIKQLMRKLYLRNPNELAKNSNTQAQTEQIVFRNLTHQPRRKDLNNTRSIDSVYLAFNADYSGDRVFALCYGLSSMLMDAYDNKIQFIFTDRLTAQKFYNLARNFEVVDWKLNNNKQANDKPFLYSNALKHEKGYNRSFERLFGKLIAEQDMMAKTLEISTSQTVKTFVMNITSGLLLPI